MNSSYIDQILEEYKTTDCYPYHMPGHKGNPLNFPNPYQIDITEIDGFDDLHNPTGIILDSQKRAANLFGADKSFFLVNGSTSGILSAISCCAPRNGILLMGRNAHKSAYHASFLRQLNPIYVMPEFTPFGIQGSISPEKIAQLLSIHKEVHAVFITSPSYDGVISDINRIAEIVHNYNIPLIVDEAHGSHFIFNENFPSPALLCGADIVIQSLHKTLPSFTQTAILHVNSERIDMKSLSQFLSIYQTSSPSYLLLAGMDRCIRLLKQEGNELFYNFCQQLYEFYRRCENLKHLTVFQPMKQPTYECFDRDFSKILISTINTNMTGRELYHQLLHEYNLQMEMVSGHYVTALMSLMDNSQGFFRLFHAMNEIDKKLADINPNKTYHTLTNNDIYIPTKQILSISAALESSGKTVLLERSVGKVCREFVYLYPPGIPILVPGEIIEERFVNTIIQLKRQNQPLSGMADSSASRINVVN